MSDEIALIVLTGDDVTIQTLNYLNQTVKVNVEVQAAANTATAKAAYAQASAGNAAQSEINSANSEGIALSYKTAAEAALQAVNISVQSQSDYNYATVGLMNADLTPADGKKALVYADITRAGANTYTVSTNCVAGDTVTFGGVTFTAVSSGATGNQFNVGASTTATASNLAASLVANATATINAIYTVTASTNVITITEKKAGYGNTPGAITKTGTIVISAGTATVSTSNGPWIKQGASSSGSWKKSEYVPTIAPANLLGDNIIYGANVYDYSKHVVNGYYINSSGVITASAGLKYAKVPANLVGKYSIYLPTVGYGSGSGLMLFMDAESNIISSFVGAEHYNPNKYNEKKYVTITKPENGAYVCFNVKLTNSDDTTTALCVYGDVINAELLSKPEIAGLFSSEIRDNTARNTLQSFKDTVKHTGGNLYDYASCYIDGKFVSSVNGVLTNAAGWGCAVETVEPGRVYSLWMPSGIYNENRGAIAFHDGDDNLLSFTQGVVATDTYEGVTWKIFATPANCTKVYHTVKGGAGGSAGADDSQTAILVAGNVVSADSIARRLSEVSGYKVKAFSYEGKTWVVVGDSLTEHNIRATANYHDYISDKLGFTVVNMGVGGTGYKKTDGSGTAFYQRISSVPTNADVVTIFGSGNDLSAGVPLGTPTDTGTSTLCGAINTTIDNFYSVCPTTPLGIITPTPWGGYPPTVTGNAMELYANALVAICKLRGIRCLDLYHCSGLRPWDDMFRDLMYSRDEGNRVHPDENGHEKYIAPPIGYLLQSICPI